MDTVTLNMIYNLIESKDVREHLKGINHIFSQSDAAKIIRINKSLSLEQKHEYWKKLIATHEDEPFLVLFHDSWPSLHEYLKKLMRLEKKLVRRFLSLQAGEFYTCQLKTNENEKIVEGPFLDFDDCVDYISCYFHCLEEDRIHRLSDFSFIKRGDQNIEVRLNDVGTIRFVTCHDVKGEDSALLWSGFTAYPLNLPTPFVHGDILSLPHKPKTVIVLDTKYTMEPQLYEEAFGYYIDRDGQVGMDEFSPLYLYERTTAPLSGRERLLKPISMYLKQELSLSQLLQATLMLDADERVKEAIPDTFPWELLKTVKRD